jgi:hypothetical protein
MSVTYKGLTKTTCASISARGGTCILDGLQAALRMLEERRSRNPSAVVFLLTDGVDDMHTREKKVGVCGSYIFLLVSLMPCCVCTECCQSNKESRGIRICVWIR